jgi:serine/threonine protein phosphatase PrpC
MAEDNFNCKSQNGLFAVFDGHAGDKAADYCQQHFNERLVQKAEALERGDTCQTIKDGKCLSSKLEA